MSTSTNRRIVVYVNDEPRRFFLGLRVRHAVGYQQAWRVERGEAMVEDGDGNRVDLDGALYDGERLYIKPVTERLRAQDSDLPAGGEDAGPRRSRQ